MAAALVEYLQKTSARLNAEGFAPDEQLLKKKVMPSVEEGIRRLSRGAPAAIRGQLKAALEEFKVYPGFEADIDELRAAVAKCLLIVGGEGPTSAVKAEPEEAMVFLPATSSTRIPTSDEWSRLCGTYKFSESYEFPREDEHYNKMQVDIRMFSDGIGHVEWFEEVGGFRYQMSSHTKLTGSVLIDDNDDGKLVFNLKGESKCRVSEMPSMEVTVKGSHGIFPEGIYYLKLDEAFLGIFGECKCVTLDGGKVNKGKP